MSELIRRLLGKLIPPPDCVECGAYDDRRLIGTYWHKDGCSRLRPVYPAGADDE